MRYFKDSKGEDWGLDVTVGSLLRVRSATGCDLIDDTGLPESVSKVVDILWVLLEPQATKRGVSQIDFAERLDGTALESAVDCLMGEWSDFFRKLSPTKSAAISGLWAKSREVEDRMAAKITEGMAKPLGPLSFDLPE